MSPLSLYAYSFRSVNTPVPAFAAHIGRKISVDGVGDIAVDAAYGGDSFVMADAADFGLSITPSDARQVAEAGRSVVKAANRQLPFHHPALPEWKHYSFCFMRGPLERENGVLTSRNACVVNPGKLDRSPTGTGCSALMAVLHAKGLMKAGDSYIGRSVIESRFTGRIAGETTVGDKPAIIPEITGRAWISGQSTLLLDPDDPWPAGYKVSDTWPNA